LQAVKEITENFIESQKTIIRSIQSAWGPYQQNFNTSVNTWNSPEAAANAYTRFVSNVADNTVAYLRTTNNLVFASLDAYKTTMQHAKENTKQKIFDINSKAAKTFEQNTREVTKEAAQDSASRFNAHINNNSNSGNNTAKTTRTTTTTTSNTLVA
jgi:hypothetical protein